MRTCFGEKTVSHRVSHYVSHRREKGGITGKNKRHQKTRNPLWIAGFQPVKKGRIMRPFLLY